MNELANERLRKQMEFIVEIDKLKRIYRQSFIMDATRNENDAEHSWHISVMAMTLLEHVNSPEIDLLRVIKMLLIHDLVEIDAGDTFAYDEKAREDKHEREIAAAQRIFGILPEEQKKEFFALWEEFEEKATLEAQYASALDRLQPMMHNYYTEGRAWRKHGVTSDKVLERAKNIGLVSRELGEFAVDLIKKAVEKGYLKP